MYLLEKLLRRVVPLAVLLLAACGPGGVQSGTVAAEIRVTTLAGQPGNQGGTDGAVATATFSNPVGITVDASDNVYVSDVGNCTIRKITTAGMVTTLAGQLSKCSTPTDGTGTNAIFGQPGGITVDTAGNLYLAEIDYSVIRKITPAGVVTTLAGKAGTRGSADGTGAAARFFSPSAIVLDAFGNLYVTDSENCTIRKITPAGVVTTLAGKAGACGSADGTGAAARFSYPWGITIDKSGNLYVADRSNNVIRKITPFGVVTTLAGKAGTSGSADGTGTAARFNSPFGIAADGSGNLYVTEGDFSGFGNNTIRKITPAGVVTTLAGKAGESGSKNGRGAVATFNYPSALAIAPDGTMYVAEFLNGTIRKIEPGWPIGGTVNGLASGASVILQDTLTDTGADTLAVNANGSFTFDMPAAVSGVYSATVLTQPAGQTCAPSNVSGTATTDVTNITVDCSGGATPTYKLGGTVSGLAAKTSLELQNSSNGENLPVAANGAFTFKGTVTAYSVTVKTQPTGQTCTPSSNSGTATADVSNVAVTCAPKTYNINVAVSGLTGTLALLDNGTDSLPINANGSFTFASQVAYNGTYNVTVQTQPTGQTCTVSNPVGGTSAGTVKGAAVNLAVQCVTNTIGGTVSGLTGTVVLQDNGGDNLPLSANGSFTFATPVNYNGAYSVSVLTQPTGQTCSVTSGGSGTATGPVTNVAVSCVASGGGGGFTIGGTLSGLSGTDSVVLQDNGGDNQTLSANGSFTFATPVASGGTYAVTASPQSTGLICSVTNGSGNATGNVTNVAVSCGYPVGGNVMGFVTGTFSGPLVLQDNGGNDLTINPDSTGSIPFTFTTPVSSGSSYSVTILTQPTGGMGFPPCTVTAGGFGTPSSSSGTGVTVTCQ